jgi:membrane protease YdiL (CAAX protease family)
LQVADYREPPTDAELRRRRLAAAATLVVGSIVLGFSLSAKPGDRSFYWLTTLLALVWIVGGFLSGPLHLGRMRFRGHLRRPLVTPIVIGLICAAIFVLGALIAREIPPIRDVIADVLDHARYGSVPLVVTLTLINGAAEEVFFRGALYPAIRRYPVVISTVIYAAVTVATGNPMLVFAALTLGFVLTWERRMWGGVLGPLLTHVTWSLVMVTALPPLFSR